jgi:maleate isomerase
VQVASSASFDEVEEARVARIDPASIRDAALHVGRGDVDAVFLSCTNLRTLDILDAVEAEIGKPVISSNQALAWHMAHLAGAGQCGGRFGRLMHAGPGQGAGIGAPLSRGGEQR